jgi:hypothetical protein
MPIQTQARVSDPLRAVGEVFPNDPNSRERGKPLIEAAQPYIRKLIEEAFYAREPDMQFPFRWAEKVEETVLRCVIQGGFENCTVSDTDIVDLVDREVWNAINSELGPLDSVAEQDALEAQVRAFMETTDKNWTATV